jgi:glycine hydroxymethyltransferase
VATQLKEVMTPEFKAYAKAVRANARALAAALRERGYKLATDGTDNHLLLWDLRPLGITGNKFEKMCDEGACVRGRTAAVRGVRVCAKSAGCLECQEV